MKRMKRDKALRAYTQGYKAGQRGHDMQSCPHFEAEARGAWFRGWREGRENYLFGFNKAVFSRMAPSYHYLNFMQTT